MAYRTKIEKIGIEDIYKYLERFTPPHGIRGVVLHHAWQPLEINNASTVEAIQEYHIGLGWSTIGANFYTGINGIWNGRSLDANNYAHANVDEEWSSVEAEAKAIAYPDKSYFNKYCIGIETAGNYDKMEPSIDNAIGMSIQLISKILKFYNLDTNDIFFHRDVSGKSCPGNNVNRDWVREMVKSMMLDSDERPVKVFVKETGQQIFCAAKIVNGKTICELRPVCDALGYDIYQDLADGHIKIKKK